jgi:large repetitive protein
MRALLALPVMLVLLATIAPAAQAAEPEATVAFSCKTFTFTFTGFPNLPKNEVKMSIRIDAVVTQTATYKFNGPSATYVFTVNLPPGHHSVDGKASWNHNGVKGGIDRTIAGGLNCGQEAEYTIQKLQKKDGGAEPFTTAVLVNAPRELGQIDYEIVVKNTGNVPLTFSSFTDPKCDEGTITGGPGANPVAAQAMTTFFCDHVLSQTDAEAGSYTNTASITAEPAGGPPKEQESNTVVVKLPPPEPGFSILKEQKLEPTTTLPKYPGSGPYTTEVLKQGHVGQVVSYEIIIVNTGNVPLKFGPLVDPKCDNGTITGGPGATEVLPGKSTVFHCLHTLVEADKTAGRYTNTATETGSPAEEDGEPVTHESNTVEVELPSPNNTVQFTCKSITFFFTGFPNLPNNTVKMHIRVDGVVGPTVTYSFNGPTGSYTFNLNLAPGHHSLDGQSSWNTNQFKGARDIVDVGGIVCNAEPAFKLEKLQRNSANKEQEPFTTATLGGTLDENVEYEVIATNTGNVPLTFSNFVDARCDEGTITGGPGTGTVAPGTSTTYLCTHVIKEAEREAGVLENAAELTGEQAGGGTPIAHTSNTVVINPIE